MRLRLPALLILWVIVPTLACATLFSDSRYSYQFESVPSGARVTVLVNGRPVQELQTPGETFIDLKSSVKVRFELSGYESHTIEIDRSLDPWIIANICNAGLGLIVDGITGSMMAPGYDTRIFWRFRPASSTAALTPAGAPNDATPYVVELTLDGGRGAPLLVELPLRPGTGERVSALGDLVRGPGAR